MNEAELADELRAQVNGWETDIRVLNIERRAKDRLLRIAEKRTLRAGRITGAFNPQNGRPVDFNLQGVNDLKLRLGQIDYEIETKEELIRETEAELCGLPQPEPEEELIDA